MDFGTKRQVILKNGNSYGIVHEEGCGPIVEDDRLMVVRWKWSEKKQHWYPHHRWVKIKNIASLK